MAQQTSMPENGDSLRTVQIDKIFLLGNKKTRPRIIHRELNFASGDTLSLQELVRRARRDEQKIFNLGLFNSVKIEILENEPDRVDVLVKVTERWYFFVFPVFRLVDRNFNDWWVNRERDLSRVNYGLRAAHFNMRGQNEKLKLTARAGFTRNFSVSYSVPYIDRNQKWGISAGFAYQERKNIAFTTVDHVSRFYESENILSRAFSPNVTATYRNGFFNTHNFTVDYNQNTLADSVFTLNHEFARNLENRQEYVRLSYSFVRDVRDFRNYPLHGFLLGGSINRLGLHDGSDANQWSMSLRLNKFFDLSKGYYLASSFAGLWSTRSDQAYAYYNAMGFGRNVIRGFELSQIETPRYVLQKNSLRKLLFKGEKNLKKFIPLEQFQKLPYAFYAKVFYDHGYAQRYPGYDGSNRLTNRYLHSYGLGLDIVTAYDFVLRLEASRNSEGVDNFFIAFKSAF